MFLATAFLYVRLSIHLSYDTVNVALHVTFDFLVSVFVLVLVLATSVLELSQ